MIPKDLAKRLNYPVNIPEFSEAIEAYANHRMEEIKTALTTAVDQREIHLLQGQFKEARDLLYLREKVQEAKDHK